jgi:hypothetical protein
MSNKKAPSNWSSFEIRMSNLPSTRPSLRFASYPSGCHRWGRGEWKGDYGDDSPKWTPELRRRLDVKSRADGVFWMCYPDFLKYFRGVDVCKHQDDWHALRVSDTFASNSLIPSGSAAAAAVSSRTLLEFASDCMYEVIIPASTWSIVSLIQPDMRGSLAKRPYVYNDIGCFVSSAYADSVLDVTRHAVCLLLTHHYHC